MKFESRVVSAGMLLLLLWLNPAVAQQAQPQPKAQRIIWSPLVWSWPELLHWPQAKSPLIDSVELGAVKIQLEKTELAVVHKQLGGVTGNRGDAGGSQSWLCYSGEEAGERWIFWPSSGEMGGMTTILSFDLRRLEANETPDRRCRSVAGEVKLPIELQLGLSPDEVRSRLGQPGRVRGQNWFYVHDVPRRIKGETWSEGHSLALRFRDGRLWAISGSQVTSN